MRGNIEKENCVNLGFQLWCSSFFLSDFIMPEKYSQAFSTRTLKYRSNMMDILLSFPIMLHIDGLCIYNPLKFYFAHPHVKISYFEHMFRNLASRCRTRVRKNVSVYNINVFFMTNHAKATDKILWIPVCSVLIIISKVRAHV